MTWRTTTFSQASAAASDPDSFAYELMELGAAGTTLVGDTVQAFVEGDGALIATLTALALERGWQLADDQQVPEENWNNSCPELWEKVQIGGFTVMPVASLEAAPPTPPEDAVLRVIPGLGFGTGHHPTTWMCLEYLSTVIGSSAVPPMRILDVGTGSGILSIGAKRLLPAASAVGIDIDPLALDNARDNAAINHLAGEITFTDTPLGELTGTFDVIFANVYNEVLIQLSPDIKRLAAPGATVILSGIALAVREQVVQCYRDTLGWPLIHDAAKGDWACVVFRVGDA